MIHSLKSSEIALKTAIHRLEAQITQLKSRSLEINDLEEVKIVKSVLKNL